MIHPICLIVGHRWVIIWGPTGPRILCSRCGRRR